MALLPRGRGRADGRQAKRRGRAAERDGAGGDADRRPARARRRSRSGMPASPPAIRSSPASTTTPPRSTTASAGRWPRSTRRRHSVVLDGIDQARRVEVDADYLAQTTLGGDVPGPPARLRRHHLLRPGHDGGPRLRDGRSLDGQAGVLRRHFAQSRGDLPLRDAGDSGRARRVRAQAVPSARPSTTSPKPPSATAPRPPPTTRRFGPSFAGCPSMRSPSATPSSTPRPASRPNRPTNTRASTSASRNAGFSTSRPSPTAKPPKDWAGASAAKSCPTPAKARSCCGTG